jgi:hypothetical protein
VTTPPVPGAQISAAPPLGPGPGTRCRRLERSADVPPDVVREGRGLSAWPDYANDPHDRAPDAPGTLACSHYADVPGRLRTAAAGESAEPGACDRHPERARSERQPARTHRGPCLRMISAYEIRGTLVPRSACTSASACSSVAVTGSSSSYAAKVRARPLTSVTVPDQQRDRPSCSPSLPLVGQRPIVRSHKRQHRRRARRLAASGCHCFRRAHTSSPVP